MRALVAAMLLLLMIASPVAAVPTVDAAVPRAWATALFIRWALDDADRNRGLLVVFALNERKAEIVVGNGWTDSQDTADAVMSDVVVAQMKAGHTEAAVTGAAGAVVDRMLLAEPASGCASGCASCAAGPGGLLPLALVGGVFALVRRRTRTPCPNCRATARISRKVVSPATTTTTGLQDVTIHCAHCHHTSTTAQTLAMVAATASTHGTWSGSGGSPGGDSSGGGELGQLATEPRRVRPIAAALALGLVVAACGGPPPRPAPPPVNVDAPPSSSPPSAAPPEPPELPDAPPTSDTALFGGACARDTLEPRLAAAVEAMQARADTLGVRLVCVRGEGPGPHRNGRAVDLRFSTHAGYGGGRGGCPKGRETTVCRAEKDRETWEAIFGAVRDTREVRWLAWEYWARDSGVIPEDGSYPRGRYSAAKRHAVRSEKWRREIGHFELR